MPSVKIAWNKSTYDNVEIGDLKTGLDFKKKCQELTGVPPERQKVMGLGAGLLKDDADLSSLKVKQGQLVRVMGSTEPVPEAPKEKIVFIEDAVKEGGEVGEMTYYPAGLENLGNTCYMNSVVETLRYVPELRQSLDTFDQSNVSDLYEKDKTLTVELKNLLNNLDSKHESFAPITFLNALRTAYPQFAEKDRNELGEFYAQQDSDEFLTNLLGSLENTLRQNDKNIIKELFEGEFEVKLQCTECEEPPVVTKESWKKLSCFISQQINNLPFGLQKSLEGTVEKESQTLGRVAVYSKIQRISKLPNYLVINFVRFFWKQKQQLKAKVLREVQFPSILDVFDLCSEEYKSKLKPVREKMRELREEEMKKKKEESLAGTSQANKKQKTENQKDLTPLYQVEESGWYELYAVVTHKGRAANEGHYVGWVKTESGQWLEFDDDDVTAVTEEDIKKLSGGGDWHVSYICLYRKCRTAP
ncbi:hypothetical protein FDP41_005440 [Naegleria fowleri]|uniref:ubiquitinyl hydrolase 1 n=1 Tax=Naegleria fowleri TaxID=5763 RepID=A0A6A5BKM9_NAEFO|nr:uncharacterized protein FDP41_005440 [Naegleria fowleri]KAF0975446.1 hypothetical protein FDP41_005440 [Naegleria fowleri]CAG4715531.1 unnamed protein product [Naegleria fowleri]